MRWPLVSLLAAAAVLAMPQPAAAADPEVVYVNRVQFGPTHSSYLAAAMTFVDRFTRTVMVLGPCVPEKRCITVQPGRLTQCERPGANGCAGTGWTSCSDTPQTRQRCTITVDTRPVPNPRGGVYWTRLYEHELAHCFEITWHSQQANNIMYAPLVFGNPEQVVPEYFKPNEQSVLAKW